MLSKGSQVYPLGGAHLPRSAGYEEGERAEKELCQLPNHMEQAG